MKLHFNPAVFIGVDLFTGRAGHDGGLHAGDHRLRGFTRRTKRGFVGYADKLVFIFVAFATSAPDPEVANFMRHYAVTLALYMKRVETGDIVDIAGAAWMLSDSNSLIGAFPLDYIAWTPGLAKSLTRASGRMASLGARDKKLFLTGNFSPLAREALQKDGWKLTEYAKFAGGESQM